MIKKVLSIAGSDTTGGGGLQADLKTFQEYGVFGINALTCFVTLDDYQQVEVELVSPQLLEKQLISIFTMHEISAIKIGMMGSQNNMMVIHKFIQQHTHIPLIVDPVLAFKESSFTLDTEIANKIVELFFPYAYLVTPNLIEAATIAKIPPIQSVHEMKIAAKKIYALGPKYVVVKGGHRITGNQAIDILYDGNSFIEFANPKINSNRNNGAGCTFAAAITAGLSKGLDIQTSVNKAKEVVFCGIQNGVPFLPYVGSVWHGAYREEMEEKQ